MIYSSLRHLFPAIETNSRTIVWPRAAGLTLFLFVFSVSSPRLFSQQSTATPDIGRKVQPSKTITISIPETEKREKARGGKLEQKKPENENLIIPESFPVPPGAKGETFKAMPLPQSTATPQIKKKDQSGLEPNFPAIGDNNTAIPPDMGGAVGPNHVVTALNSQVRMQDKNGGALHRSLECFP